MELPHNYPLYCPSTSVVIFLENTIALFVGLLKAMEHRVNTQRQNKKELPVDAAQGAGRWNVLYSDVAWNKSTNDEETSSEQFQDYDTKLTEDACRQSWYNDYDDPEYIETVLDHKEYINQQN